MPRRLSREEQEAFLRGRHVAVLGTVSVNGQIILTPIWYLYQDGRILMRTGKESVKARNIARDRRVSICIQDERPPYRSLTVYGRASIEPARDELGAEIARHYLGALAGAAYTRTGRQSVEEGEEVTLVLTPERIVTKDYSADTPPTGKLWLWLKRLLPPGL